MLCPKCRRNFPEEDVFCPFDGTPLVVASTLNVAPGSTPAPESESEAKPTTRMSVDDVEAALASGEFPGVEQPGRRKPSGEVKPTTRMSVEDVEAALVSDEYPNPMAQAPQDQQAPQAQAQQAPQAYQVPQAPQAQAQQAPHAQTQQAPLVHSRESPTVQLPPDESSASLVQPAPLALEPLERSAEPPRVVLGPASSTLIPEPTENFTHIKAGSTVGEYKITGVLGHGGMTQVFAGVHPVIGKRVALKVLHAQYTGDDGLLGRFVQEAKAVNHVGSDRIVDIFGFGHLPDGRAYLVMNQVDGQPLSDLIEAGGPLATTQAHSIFQDVAEALAAAHSVGIIHRDVKPSNIMVQTDNYGAFRSKVLDFGVAKLLRTDAHSPGMNTAKGTMIGTPLYMSPEQVRGQAVDARSDAYALGVTMFQCLTGDVPFDVSYDMDIAVAHVEQQPRVPSTLRPNLSAEWDQLILDCLEKDPARRPQSMLDIQTRLAVLGTSATRGGTGYVDLPSYAKPQEAITAMTLKAASEAPARSPSRWPLYIALTAGALLASGALYYLLAR